MSNGLSPEALAKIEAFRTKMGLPSAGKSAAAGGGDASGGDAGGGDAGGGDAGGGGSTPAGGGDDMASKMAAIRARVAQAKAGGGGAPAAAKPAAAAAPAGGGGTATATVESDVASRIAALKAKMEASKGGTKPAPSAAAPRKPTPKPGGKNIWPVAPVDRTSFGAEFLYRPGTLAKWFLVSSLLLTVTGLAMWERDWVRDWKFWQERKREIDIAMAEQDIAQTEAAIDPQVVSRAQAEVDAAEARLSSVRGQLDELTADVQRLEGEQYRDNQDFQFAKSEFDALRYQFEMARLLEGGDEEDLAESEKALEAKRQEMNEKQAAADEVTLELQAKKAELAALQATVTDAEKARDALTADLELKQGRLAKIDHNIFNDYVRNLPMVDMLRPTLKIDQIVLDDIKDNYNFMFVGRVDRCTTCHAAIDKTAYVDHDPHNDKHEMVLNAHPRLDLFVSDTSPHPMKEFGCTVCHQGRGQAVEFERTFHVPAADPWEGGETAEEKEARWVADYGYEPDRHYWDWPMVPQDKIYSACFQCHQDTARIPGVPEYNRSRDLVETLGCYGCHKIEGFEGYRKVGPDLTNLVKKVQPDWVRKWVMDPRGFRPTTRMPHFFNQSNRGANPDELAAMGHPTDVPWNNNADRFVDDYRARNEVEARALTAYVFHQSKEASTFELQPVPKGAGDADHGRELFQQRGCLACHSMASEGWTEAEHGPDLSAIGTKTSPAWLFNWLQDPKRYYPTTVMPNLRLSPEEAWDVTAYLMAQRDDAWDKRPEPRADDAILDGIAVEYLSGLTSVEAAQAEVARRRAQDGRDGVELYVGEKLFNHYGCAGCHLVPGHYDDKGIGTELTKEGLKELSKFDFGFEGEHTNPRHIPHTRHDWFATKLRDPRVFDRMPVVAGHGDDAVIERYDQKVKQPADKLKMPNFHLTDEEVDLLVQFLMGLREEGVGPAKHHRLDAEGMVAERASRLMTEVNCVGCHRLGVTAQRVPLDEDTIDEGLEYDLWTARPIAIDGQTIWHEQDWFTDLVYDPWEEEDVDTVDLLKEHPGTDHALLYGDDEGILGRYIADKALRPPTLRREGDKTQADWLFDFLKAPYTVRNHVKARMPTFGFTHDEAQALAHWFSVRDGEDWPFDTTSLPLDRDALAKGATLFEKYQCQSCHPQGDVLPANPDPLNWGPDLSLARRRLEPDWMQQWLLDPQKLSPGTKMPNFFGEYVDGEYEVYDEDYDEGIPALVQYLVHMDEYVPPPEVSMSDDEGK